MTFTHEQSLTLAAAPPAVFAALTDAQQLRQWFAEEAEVGAASGEPYRFWGRHTLDMPSAAQASQRITRYERDKALGFAWTIGGVATEVTMALSVEGDATRVALQHAVAGDLDRPRAAELIDDHWRLAFGNLASHLAGGDGIVLPDYSDPSPQIRQVIMIDAPRELVFRCLIEPALINQWFGSKSSSVEPRVGGRYDLSWKYDIDGHSVDGGPTRILDYVQDRRLVLDWPDWRGDKSVSGQTISFDLETAGEGTRVTFVHAGFGRPTDMSDYPFGWRWFLGELQKVATHTAQDR